MQLTVQLPPIQFLPPAANCRLTEGMTAADPKDLAEFAADADAWFAANVVADPGEDCINLAVTTGRLKFDSLIQKIAAPLFGF